MGLTKKYLNQLTYDINGAAIEVHKHLGPGLLENVYHRCLAKEFDLRNINFQSELLVEVAYKGEEIDTQLKCDFLVESAIVVELKSVAQLHPVHQAQLFTYMKLLQKPKGILINFNVAHIFKEGQKTMVNELFRQLPDE